MEAKPKIITLCGSTKFIEWMAIMAWELEKQGAIVLGLHLLPDSYFKQKDIPKTMDGHQAEYENVAEHFDNLHLRKIDISDSIYVINVDGYIGESTKREIEYAKQLNKPIEYLEPEKLIENVYGGGDVE
jgi:hypothetical protein